MERTMSNFKKLVEARMAETGEGWQAASAHVREQVLAEESEAVKEHVRKLKGASSFPHGAFIGPRNIEPGQMIDLVHELTVDDWPWSPTHLQFIDTLRGQGLFIETMTIGRRDQIFGGPVPVDVFVGGKHVGIGADMITIEKPLKMQIRNNGTKPQIVVGYLSGIGHSILTQDPRASFDALDVQRVMVPLDILALPPRTTKTARVAPPCEPLVPGFSRTGVPVMVGVGGSMAPAEGVEYTISRFMMPSLDDVFVDIRIDGESATGGYVESKRFGYAGSMVREINLGLPPIEFKQTYTKGKTQIEVVIKNDSDLPHDFGGHIDLVRHLTLGEIESAQEQRRNPHPSVQKHQERFPWNIDGAVETVPIARGETKTLSGQPQCIFRAKELVVDPECREHFEIVDVKVGVDPCPLFDKPIPASRFHEDNGLDLKLDPASPGIIMRLIVKNVSKETRDFGATVKGDALF
jgi:hypothetical protein